MGKLLVVDFKKWMELDSSKVLETWLSQFLVTSRSFSYLSLPALIGIEEWMLRKNLDSWFCRNVVGMTSKVPEQTSTGRTMKPDLKEEERSRFWVTVVFPLNASEVEHFQAINGNQLKLGPIIWCCCTGAVVGSLRRGRSRAPIGSRSMRDQATAAIGTVSVTSNQTQSMYTQWSSCPSA